MIAAAQRRQHHPTHHPHPLRRGGRQCGQSPPFPNRPRLFSPTHTCRKRRGNRGEKGQQHSRRILYVHLGLQLKPTTNQPDFLPPILRIYRKDTSHRLDFLLPLSLFSSVWLLSSSPFLFFLPYQEACEARHTLLYIQITSHIFPRLFFYHNS